MSSQEQ